MKKNKAKLLSEGEDIAHATFKLIEDANKEILSIEFLLRDDEFGLKKLALLRKKAQQGIKVRAQIDSFHLFVSPAIIAHLVQDGVEFTVYNHVSLSQINRAYFRNHCKVLVVDGKYLKTGDTNSGNEYVQWGDGLKMKSMDILIEGPLVMEARQFALDILNCSRSYQPKIKIADQDTVNLQRKQIRFFGDVMKSFFRTFQIEMDAADHITRPDTIFITEEEFQHAKRQLDAVLLPDVNNWEYKSRSVRSAFFFADPIDSKGVEHGCEQTISDFIKDTKSDLTIVTPYLLLTPTIREALISLFDSKVRIRIFTNSLQSTDNRTVQMAYEYNLPEMADLGHLEVYEFKGPETLHSKILLRDAQDVMVTSYNIDWRSELWDLQNGVILNSPELESEIQEWLISHSEQFKLVVHDKKVLKDQSEFTGPSQAMKKLIIQSIENHL